MHSGFAKLKAFLTAEEVPRWFGLSIVLIYLAGVGVVARFGIAQVRREASAFHEASSAYAVASLSERLAAIAREPMSEQERSIAQRIALREFSSHIPAITLRVVDSDRRVAASIVPAEVGTIVAPLEFAPPRDDSLHLVAEGEGLQGKQRRYAFSRDLARVSSAVGAPPQRGGPGEASYYLEGELPAEARGAVGLAEQLNFFVIVCLLFGALFVVYRCLRQQLRGARRITERLESHRGHIEDHIEALRVAGATDDASKAWNELIDLVHDAVESTRRSRADEELTRVLSTSGGGALADALHAVPDGFMYVTDEVKIEYANISACKLCGFDPKEVRGTLLTEARVEGVGAKVIELMRESLQPNGKYMPRIEVIQSQHADGRDPTTYRLWIIPLSRTQRQGECVVVARDVSQQVRADQAREELISQVTHELRTPLTNIRAYAETLSSGMFDDPKVVTECYNVISKETRRLSRLIEDMLSVSQLDVGGIELQIDQVDLKALLSEGVRDVRGLADEKNIDIQLLLPSKLEPIRGDRDKLAVVLNNLLGNAVKYTPNDGNIVIGCQVSGSEVVLTIKDNGIGIDAEDHARVFEKFYRVRDEDVQSEPGTGIGLYTAREIARRHGGDIELISSKGEGSTFMVRLPHEETRAAGLSMVEAR